MYNRFIKYFLFVLLLNLAIVKMSTNERKLTPEQIKEEEENKRYKQMLENYENKMKAQKPVEYPPGYLEYKNHIIGEIIKRAEK
jgi:hypothetical protein